MMCVYSTKLRTTSKQKKKKTVNILVTIPLDFSKYIGIYFHKHELMLCEDRSVICCSYVTDTWGHVSLETFKVLLPQLAPGAS